MILIADCGSTKIDWCLVEKEEIIERFTTPGMNAVMLSPEEMKKGIAAGIGESMKTAPERIEAVYFYGAGCISPEVCSNVADAIRATIPASKIEVATDLLAAARALCGHKPGIACILGTGSNSCYYDGEKIVDNVSPLGYILGDEGSGAVLGKLLVGDVLKNQIPAPLGELFLEEYNLDRLEIIRRVYREPGGNRFLASLSPFLLANIEVPQVHDLVVNAFKAFFVRNIHNYKGYETMDVNFVGSIAHYYREQLAEAASLTACRIGTILRSPMEGLIKFHAV